MPFSLNVSISALSDALLIPCPIRTAPSSNAFHTLSAPAASPACIVNGMPSLAACLNISAKSPVGYAASSPARSMAHTPFPRYFKAILTVSSFSLWLELLRIQHNISCAFISKSVVPLFSPLTAALTASSCVRCALVWSCGANLIST